MLTMFSLYQQVLQGYPFAVPIYHQHATIELPHSLQVMGKVINEFHSEIGNRNVGGGIGEKQLKVALALEARAKVKLRLFVLPSCQHNVYGVH